MVFVVTALCHSKDHIVQVICHQDNVGSFLGIIVALKICTERYFSLLKHLHIIVSTAYCSHARHRKRVFYKLGTETIWAVIANSRGMQIGEIVN